jgi:hypothetical protein
MGHLKLVIRGRGDILAFLMALFLPMPSEWYLSFLERMIDIVLIIGKLSRKIIVDKQINNL